MKENIIQEHEIIQQTNFISATKGDILHTKIQFERGLDYYASRIEAIAMKGFQHILDAGCGCGQWSIVLADVNESISALDINAGLLEIARMYTRKYNKKNIQYYQGDLHLLPFGDETFDAVFSYSVLMCTKEDEVIREFSRVLKPGGKIYICSDGPGWPLYKVFIFGLKNGRLRSIVGALLLVIRTFINLIFLKRFVNKITFLRKKDIEALFEMNDITVAYYGPDGSFGNTRSENFKPLYGEKFFGLPADFEIIGIKNK